MLVSAIATDGYLQQQLNRISHTLSFNKGIQRLGKAIKEILNRRYK